MVACQFRALRRAEALPRLTATTHAASLARSIWSMRRTEEPPMSKARVKRHTNPKGRDLEAIELEIDEHGSPVTLEAGGWYVCFVPGLKKQWWHRFVHNKHKHVFAMRPAGNGEWTLFEPWWHRL